MPHEGVPHFSDPIDLDSIFRYIALGNNSAPGTTRWGQAVSGLLRELSRIALDANDNYTGPRAAAAAQAVQWLTTISQQFPGQFNAVFEDVAGELGLIGPPEGGSDILDLGAIIAEAVGDANPELQDIISTIKEEVDRTRDEIIDITTTGEQRITETRDIFVDVPTPEEVLNDFRTGVAVFAENLFAAGEIDANTRRFLLNNPNVLLGPYLGMLGQMADAGQNIFEVVGTDFELIPIEQIGERIGPEVLREIRETIERIETGELTIEELTERVQNDLLTGTSDPDQEREIRETIEEIFRQHGTTTTTEETVTNLLQLTTERIFQRPNLATVFAVSPLDFLRERFTGTGLVTLARTLPGQEQFERQFPGGVAPSGARRLG